jgi:hypothetical protein
MTDGAIKRDALLGDCFPEVNSWSRSAPPGRHLPWHPRLRRLRYLNVACWRAQSLGELITNSRSQS